MAKKVTNSDLVADLTWSVLYTANIRETLKVLAPAVKRTSNVAELTESATLLRQQLEDAHRTAVNLTKILRLELHRSN